MPNSIDRRRFFQAGAGGAAFAAGASAHGSESPRIGEKTYREAAKDVPIVDHHDVVVCGAGPAGVAAAIAAARQGAKTQLIEFHGCLGGVWTAGLLSWILDSSNKSGIMREIIEQLKKRDATQTFFGSVAYDPEPMKILLEEMCLEAGVHCRLHTQIVGAAVEDGRLRLAVTESKSGREAFSGDVLS